MTEAEAGSAPRVGARALARGVDAALWLGVALGAVARIVRYVDGRSFWADEAALALNLWKRAPSELLAPLDFGQAAPAGFLWLERGLLALFGPGELALRALPLAASLAALALAFVAARRLLGEREALVALFLVATCEPLVYYASELKPYAVDACVALALLASGSATLGALESGERFAARAVRIGALGALAPWLSFPAVFALPALGALLALGVARAARDRDRAASRGDVAALAAVALAWVGSLAALFVLQLADAREDPYLGSFWENDYPPFPPHTSAELAALARTAHAFFADPAGLPASGVAFALAALGSARALRARALGAWLLLAPALVAAAAAAAELYPLRTFPPVAIADRSYPFAGRLWLFAVPAALVAIASGIGALRAAFGSRRALGEAAAALVLAALVAPSLKQLAINAADPPRVQEFAAVASRMSTLARPGDLAWIQRGSEPTFEFYARREQLPVSARNAAARTDAERAALARDASAFEPGQRVWLVALDHPAWGSAVDEERAALASLLAARARERERVERVGALAVLYEVEGPSASARSSSPGPTR